MKCMPHIHLGFVRTGDIERRHNRIWRNQQRTGNRICFVCKLSHILFVFSRRLSLRRWRDNFVKEMKRSDANDTKSNGVEIEFDGNFLPDFLMHTHIECISVAAATQWNVHVILKIISMASQWITLFRKVEKRSIQQATAPTKPEEEEEEAKEASEQKIACTKNILK